MFTVNYLIVPKVEKYFFWKYKVDIIEMKPSFHQDFGIWVEFKVLSNNIVI